MPASLSLPVRPWKLIVGLILGWTVYEVICRIQSRQVLKRKERALSCQSPRSIPHICPYGLNHFIRFLKALSLGKVAPLTESYFERGGNTFEIRILGGRMLATQEGENVKAIVKTYQSSFTTASRADIIGILIKNSVLSQDGHAWRHTRDLMRFPFSRERYHDLDLVRGHANNLIALLPENEPVDAMPLFFRYAVDGGSSFLFGKSVDSLALPRRQADEDFEKAFEFCLHYVITRGYFRRIARFFDESEFKKQKSVLCSYIENVMKEAGDRSEKVEEERDYSTRKKTPLLDALMKGKDDPEEVKDHLLICFAAARQTTASMLSWTFRLLARHPKVLEHLRTEIETILPGKCDALSRNDLKKMTYLNNMLREVLRLYPITHAIGYAAAEDVILPTGGGADGEAQVLLQKGETVNICLWTMHRRKDIWGEDADEFRPERWEGESPVSDVYHYIPFLRGPRNCPGQDFALTEASYLIVRIVQEFRTIRVAKNDPRPEFKKEEENFKMSFVIEPGDGCLLEFER